MKKTFLLALLAGFLFQACKSTKKTVSSTPTPPTPAQPVQPRLQMVDIDDEEPEKAGEEPVFEVVEKLPEFPGGPSARSKYIMNNIIYPEADKNAGIEGTSYVQFVVGKTGEISDVRIFPGSESQGTEAMHAESMRLVSNMPNWIPGTQGGKPVAVRYMMPIKYALR